MLGRVAVGDLLGEGGKVLLPLLDHLLVLAEHLDRRRLGAVRDLSPLRISPRRDTT